MEKKAVYTQEQMLEMMSVTRSWTLNNPSGPLPYLPMIWLDEFSQEDNEKVHRKTMPPTKKPHWLISILMKLRVI